MDLSKLWEQRNELVRLHFRDGEEVEARLLSTDPPSHSELTYRVLSIRRRPLPPNKGTAVGAIIVAASADLVDWEPVAGTSK